MNSIFFLANIIIKKHFQIAAILYPWSSFLPLMKLGFSEFTYGYAVVHQLQVQNNLGFKAWPFFPSLRIERNFGADTFLRSRRGVFFFLQFKLSEKMVSRNAIEFRNTGHGNPIFNDPPVYRFHLMPGRISSQHRDLLNLERSGRNGRKVYYVAPSFDGVEFHRMQSDPRQVISKSVWVRPSYLSSIVDDGPHHVSFDTPNGDVYTYSKPMKIEHSIDLYSFSREINNSLESVKMTEIDEHSLIEIEEDILKIATESKNIKKEHIENVIKNTNELDAVGKISFYAFNFLDLLTVGATIR